MESLCRLAEFLESMANKKSTDPNNLAEWAKANKRQHAGLFTCEENIELQEAGALNEFVTALKRGDKLFFKNVRRGNDPPDFEADDTDGNDIGIEVTEFVESSAAAAARAGIPYEKTYWRDDLISELDAIIRTKDGASLREGDSFSDYVLLVYTDEAMESLDATIALLEKHAFPATTLITRAFFLISYLPGFEYPLIELKIAGR